MQFNQFCVRKEVIIVMINVDGTRPAAGQNYRVQDMKYVNVIAVKTKEFYQARINTQDLVIYSNKRKIY